MLDSILIPVANVSNTGLIGDYPLTWPILSTYVLLFLPYIPIASGITGDLDCVHLMYPDVHGASSLVAAGSRDCNVYLWRQRAGGKEEGRRRSMRNFTGTQLAGHRVRLNTWH